MGINQHFIRMLETHPPSGHGASFGYPDLVLDTKERTPSESLWKRFDVQVDIFDVRKLRGMETVLDLNEPLHLDIVGKYDFLINPGTYEHCFNIANAMRIGCQILKPGAFGYHTGPIGRGKHGYWNYTRDTFSEFYRANGGEVVWERKTEGTLFVVTKNGDPRSAKFPQETRER